MPKIDIIAFNFSKKKRRMRILSARIFLSFLAGKYKFSNRA